MYINLLKDRSIALADCNNFFVSCERRVDPRLNGRPVVVLSGNDGCIISRSNEVKALGVPMGIPYFKVKEMLAYYGVTVRSASHGLYRDISSEVMSIIREYTDLQEIYSIDECFFNMAIHSIADPQEYCRKLNAQIWRCCRIPVSFGIAPTKTLAKLGAEYAKKHCETNGVFWMSSARYKDPTFMGQFACRDVWGIGPKAADRMRLSGIFTVPQFAGKDDLWIKNRYGINGLNTAWELRGFSTNPVQNKYKPPQSIMVSRSFGEPVQTFSGVRDALLSFTAAAAAQLRRAKLSAGHIDIFIATNRFSQDYYSNSSSHIFHNATNADGALIHAASSLLKQIYIEGLQYKKCGVILSHFSGSSFGKQTKLFGEEAEEKQNAALAAIDAINRESGKTVIKPAVLLEIPEKEKTWKSRSEYRTKIKCRELYDGTNLRFQSHSEDFS